MMDRVGQATFVILTVIAAAGFCGEGSKPVILVDFTRGADTWPSIDDEVMGGVSVSEMVSNDGFATFRGVVSFDNNGGFASVRSPSGRFDLSAFDGLVLRVRGDGKSYRFRVRTAAAFDGVSYQAPLAPAAGEWQEVMIPFSSFEPVFRGRKVPGHPSLEPANVQTLGVIIARQEGPFALDIAWIGAYRNEMASSTRVVTR